MRNLALFGLAICLCAGCAQAPLQLALSPSGARPVAKGFEPTTFASGAIIKNVAVTDNSRILWDPDGNGTKIIRFNEFGIDRYWMQDKAIVIVVQSPKDLGWPTIVVRDSEQKSLGNPMEIIGPNPHNTFSLGTWLVVAEGIPGKQERIDISIGIASGPWQTLGVYELINGRMQRTSGSKFEFVVQNDSPEFPPQTVKIVSHLVVKTRDREFRYLVKDRHGAELDVTSYSSWSGENEPSEYRFRGKRSDIRTIELQSRKFEWQSYYGVQLSPNFKLRQIHQRRPGRLPQLGLRQLPCNPLIGPGTFR